MAYKDEYEVARIYADPTYLKGLKEEFGEDVKPTFYLAPPLFAKKDHNGLPIKKKYGPWMLHVFRVLARLKGLRGTRFDLVGWMDERKHERQLRDDYIARIRAMLPDLSAEKLDTAVEIAELPDQIRGYGYVKEASIEESRCAPGTPNGGLERANAAADRRCRVGRLKHTHRRHPCRNGNGRDGRRYSLDLA